MITANNDVADGLANGAVGKLSHFELDDQNRVLWFWLLFPNGVGVKARGKVVGYANAKGIGREMFHINRKFVTVPLNRNRPNHAKRNHFPLKLACSLQFTNRIEEHLMKLFTNTARHIHNLWST
ncbi:hypothetical protein TNCV_1935551 [Trichonephila clavipes]|nr:hypothetical protein TNCV_1935551 [Trichonephila clavipes]